MGAGSMDYVEYVCLWYDQNYNECWDAAAAAALSGVVGHATTFTLRSCKCSSCRSPRPAYVARGCILIAVVQR